MEQDSRLRGGHRTRLRHVFVLAVGMLAVAGLALESPAAAAPGGVARAAPAPAAAATLMALASTTNGPIGCTRGHPAPRGSVRCTPERGTPHFPARSRPTEQVRQLVQCGSRMYAVGTFRE